MNDTHAQIPEALRVPVPSFEKKTISLAEFCEQYGIGKTLAYQEIKTGRLRIAKVGRRTLVPVSAANLWLQQRTETTV